MKESLKWAFVVLLGVLVGAGLAIVLVSGVRGESADTLAGEFLAHATADPYGIPPDVRSGAAYGLTGEQTPVPSLWPRGDGFGPGMMAGYGGWGMAGTGMHGFGRGPWASSYGGERLSADQALEAARQYLIALGDPNLELAELMEFSNRFYIDVAEISTGIHAFELLMDPCTGAVYPEPGANMMWNTKYGHMGGWWVRPTEVMQVTPDQAREIAQRWSNFYMSGAAADDAADVFHGYYTMRVLRDGQVKGMLSVNGYTGQVWYHRWHGDFIQMQELEG